jgi:hypothetical protein
MTWSSSRDLIPLAVLITAHFATSTGASAALAQAPQPGDRPQSVESRRPTELAVSPAAEPVPALRYRLLPIASELNPGDAAPIYLRIRHELDSDTLDSISEKERAWADLPLDALPRTEAHAYVDQWGGRLKLLELAARREYCDWSYTLREQHLDAIEILLPDAQGMRTWARLLSLKARVESAEGRFDEALRTTESGMAMGRHIAEAPFLISDLIGVATESLMLDRVEELIARPDAPNLYWALTALPRPLISFREAMEYEQQLAEFMIPELTEVDQEHTTVEWTVLMSKLHRNLLRVARKLVEAEGSDQSLLAYLGPDVGAFKARALPDARAYLHECRGLSQDQIDRMPDDQILAVGLAGQYRELRDNLFKLSYLPYSEAKRMTGMRETLLERSKSGLGGVFAALLPSVGAAERAGVQLDRRVAVLRVIEAIRMYSAGHDGALPDSLDAIEQVPVPIDPATGTPFAYERDGDFATLSAPPIENAPKTEIGYRITIRK